MANAIEIAVVGHTNAGKTSLLRTLTRRGSFGEVSEQPGTTRHVEAVELAFDGSCTVRFFDTPGLEDSVALFDYLRALDRYATPPERIRAFLQGPEARRSFEQEAKVLRTMLDVDAAFYVIDCREPVLPKFRAEIDILASCGKPVMPVLNFVRHADSRAAEWHEALSAHGLHALAHFDAVAPFTGSEQQIYRDLTTLLRSRQQQLEAIVAYLEVERLERRSVGLAIIASLLVDVTAMRRTVSTEALAEPIARKRFVGEFRAAVITRARAGVDDLLEVYAFGKDEADLAVMPWLDGRWEADLFNPEALKAASLQLGAGAAIGASVGAVADVALAGLSLGAATAIGAALGGAVSQGFGPLGRSVVNSLRGREDLSLENEVIQGLAMQLLGLLWALEERGHAAQAKVPVAATLAAAASAGFDGVVKALVPARGRPEWSLQRKARSARHYPQRERLVEDVTARLGAVFVGAARTQVVR